MVSGGFENNNWPLDHIPLLAELNPFAPDVKKKARVHIRGYWPRAGDLNVSGKKVPRFL